MVCWPIIFFSLFRSSSDVRKKSAHRRWILLLNRIKISNRLDNNFSKNNDCLRACLRVMRCGAVTLLVSVCHRVASCADSTTWCGLTRRRRSLAVTSRCRTITRLTLLPTAAWRTTHRAATCIPPYTSPSQTASSTPPRTPTADSRQPAPLHPAHQRLTADSQPHFTPHTNGWQPTASPTPFRTPTADSWQPAPPHSTHQRLTADSQPHPIPHTNGWQPTASPTPFHTPTADSRQPAPPHSTHQRLTADSQPHTPTADSRQTAPPHPTHQWLTADSQPHTPTADTRQTAPPHPTPTANSRQPAPHTNGWHPTDSPTPPRTPMADSRQPAPPHTPTWQPIHYGHCERTCM